MKKGDLILLGVIAFVISSWYLYRHFIYMKSSSKLLNDWLPAAEGIKYSMYYDSKGLPTIGIGHLILPSEKWMLTATLTKKQVVDLFRKDIERFEKAVNDAVLVPLTQNKFDALVSFAYNIGTDGFKGSTVVKNINLFKTEEEVAKAMMMWKKPIEIKERRAKEAVLFTKGDYNYHNLAITDINRYLLA